MRSVGAEVVTQGMDLTHRLTHSGHKCVVDGSAHFDYGARGLRLLASTPVHYASDAANGVGARNGAGDILPAHFECAIAYALEVFTRQRVGSSKDLVLVAINDAGGDKCGLGLRVGQGFEAVCAQS